MPKQEMDMIDETDDKSGSALSAGSGWLLPLVNLLIILLAVCILLLSMSRPDGFRLAEAVGSIRVAFGLEALPLPAGGGMARGETRPVAELMEFEQAVELVRIKEKLAAMHAGMPDAKEPPEVRPVDEGFLIRLSRASLFVDGTVTLRSEVEPLLQQMALMFARMPNRIRIDSHAGEGRLPGGSPVSGIWAMTAAEAATLADFLVHSGKLDPARLTPSGHRQPREGQEGGAGRSARIDILLTREVHSGPAP